MTYCTECGTEVDPDDAFCTSCGAPIEHGGGAGAGAVDEPAEAGGGGAAGGRAESETATETSESPGQATETATPATESAVEETEVAEDTEVPDEAADEDTGPTAADTRGRLIAAGGIVLTAVGAFLPWLTVDVPLMAAETKAGIEGDGVVTLTFAILAGIAILVGKGKRWSKKSRAFVLVLGLLVMLLAVTYINDPWAFSEEPPSEFERSLITTHIEAGLYATALGGGLFSLGPLYATFGDS